jgi:hypothetical protein
MNKEERNKIISRLYAQANENQANLFSEMVSLLSDMEARISILEAKAELPIPSVPVFGVPAIPGSFMTLNGIRKKNNLPPIQQEYEGKEKDLYLYLLEKGCEESEATAIAKELEEISSDANEPEEIANA